MAVRTKSLVLTRLSNRRQRTGAKEREQRFFAYACEDQSLIRSVIGSPLRMFSSF